MKNKLTFLKEIRSWVIIIALALLFSTLINSQLFAMATVKEYSMEDTLYENHLLVVNRLSYKRKSPKRGDIIIFYKQREIGSFAKEFIRSFRNIISLSKLKEDSSESRDRLVKRVIAVPGDVIDIRDGCVYLNEECLDEPYTKGITEQQGYLLPITVGEGQLFVIGDNREESMDSRDFGPIEISHVEGKASFRIFPLNKIGKLK